MVYPIEYKQPVTNGYMSITNQDRELNNWEF